MDHLVVLLIKALAGQISFPHFFLEARVGVSQLGGAVLDLAFESLQGLLLLFDVGAGAEPLHDGARGVAYGNGADELPAIALSSVA